MLRSQHGGPKNKNYNQYNLKNHFHLFLKNIKLTHFKNYRATDFEFHPQINLVTGLNGTGKTNLLDAVYYLCIGKSAFQSTDSLNILEGEDFFRIEGDFSNDTMIACAYPRGKKKLLQCNDVNYNKISEHIGFCPVILIAPDDIQIVKGGSLERRKLIDTVLCQIYPQEYLINLVQYNRQKQQRNVLLKDFFQNRVFDADLLESHDVPLVKHGIQIFETRKQWLADLQETFQEYYERLSGGKEKVGLFYHSALTDQDFAELLKLNREKDRYSQRTTAGIHTDDLRFTINGRPLKKMGSQGQQKSFLIALMLTLYNGIQRKREKAPILLLDDIFDKLDENRLKALLDLISEDDFGQVFISDTSAIHISGLLEEENRDFKQFKI